MKTSLITLTILLALATAHANNHYTNSIKSEQQLQQASELLLPGERWHEYQRERRLIDPTLPSLTIQEFELAHQMQGRDNNGQPLDDTRPDGAGVRMIKAKISKLARVNGLTDPYDTTQTDMQARWEQNAKWSDKRDVNLQMDRLESQLIQATDNQQLARADVNTELLVERLNALESQLAQATIQTVDQSETDTMDKVAYAGMGLGAAGMFGMGAMAYTRRRTPLS